MSLFAFKKTLTKHVGKFKNIFYIDFSNQRIE